MCSVCPTRPWHRWRGLLSTRRWPRPRARRRGRPTSTRGWRRSQRRSAVAGWLRSNRRPPRQKRHKTGILTEVICTLGKLPVRAILTGTQHRLPTPPQRPTARTRIGYEHVDRLLSYPQANNLSAWWQPIHLAATNPRNGSASASRRANAGNIKAACRSTDKPSNTHFRAPHQHAQILLNSHRVRQSPPQCRMQFSHTFFKL